MKQRSLVWRGNSTGWRGRGPWPHGASLGTEAEGCAHTDARDHTTLWHVSGRKAEQSKGREGGEKCAIFLILNSSGCTGKPWEELVTGWHLSRDLNDNRKVAGKIKIRTKISFDTLSTWDIWVINMSTKIISSSAKNYITVLSENREMSKRRPRHDNN